MSSKPSIPKGTRDFSTGDMLRREYIFETIKQVFRLYGYQPIETPAMENLSTLMGKYGEEGDKLLFRILNSGDFLSQVNDQELLGRETGRISSRISEKGLRYDLTVPFARYVVQHRDEIVFPFKRYQIQPVWRADRPQKGRYREFFQCDVDVIGSNSLLNEAELVQIIDDVFERLKINVKIRLNNRKILSGIAEYAGVPERITDITVALDKFEKIGWESVKEELAAKNISKKAINEFEGIIRVIDKDNNEKISFLTSLLKQSSAGSDGLEEMKVLLAMLSKAGLRSEVVFDLTLARGLNYYTGAIIEVKSSDFNIGSICGGGRYDNLTGVFGLEGISGVGVSFGADRIFDVLNGLDLFASVSSSSSTFLALNFGPDEAGYAMKILADLRNMNIGAELYPDKKDQVKLNKQMAYADARKIPYIIIAGEDEMNNNTVTIKNMSTGVQVNLSVSELGTFVNDNIKSVKF